jgi:hypothetical protein
MRIKIKELPETSLSPVQRTHLRAAREIIGDIPLNPAELQSPNMSIIGACDIRGGKAYIVPKRLDRLSTTLNTALHEAGHYISKKGDGSKEHDEAIRKLSAEVAEKVRQGAYDKYLVEAVW